MGGNKLQYAGFTLLWSNVEREREKGRFRNVCVRSVEYPFYQGFQEGPAAGETRGLFHVNSPPIELPHILRLT